MQDSPWRTGPTKARRRVKNRTATSVDGTGPAGHRSPADGHARARGASSAPRRTALRTECGPGEPACGSRKPTCAGPGPRHACGAASPRASCDTPTAVEIAREGVPLLAISRQLGHSNSASRRSYLQGIENAIIETGHAPQGAHDAGVAAALNDSRASAAHRAEQHSRAWQAQRFVLVRRDRRILRQARLRRGGAVPALGVVERR